MCRNIKPLYNFEPVATSDEIQAAALQYVRKVSGFHEPSKANEAAFQDGIMQIAQATQTLLNSLSTEAPPHDREVEAAKAKARSLERFAKQS